jgi:hypothetical protein
MDFDLFPLFVEQWLKCVDNFDLNCGQSKLGYLCMDFQWE